MNLQLKSALVFYLFVGAAFHAYATAEEPIRKISPGEVIVPTERMRRIWAELVSVDLETRTGTFRAEGDDAIMHFTALPYAEMLHHATFGDLRDFVIGERAIFRMHETEAGEWVWLTYIQDEMNMLNGHKEYYFVDAIDAENGKITFTQAKDDKSFVRETGLILETDADTKFWENGEPAKFTDIKVGDMLRAKSHGMGKGRRRIAWHVFLDDASLQKFQAEQMEVHARRMTEEGLPGYVDRASDRELELTLFQEAGVLAANVESGQEIQVAPAGVNRKPTAERISGTVRTNQRQGKLFKVTLKTDAPVKDFRAKELARLWVK